MNWQQEKHIKITAMLAWPGDITCLVSHSSSVGRTVSFARNNDSVNPQSAAVWCYKDSYNTIDQCLCWVFPWLQIAPPYSASGFATWQVALQFHIALAFPLVFVWTELWSGVCGLEIRVRTEGLRRLSLLHPPWRLQCTLSHWKTCERSLEGLRWQWPSSVHTFVVSFTLFSHHFLTVLLPLPSVPNTCQALLHILCSSSRAVIPTALERNISVSLVCKRGNRGPGWPLSCPVPLGQAVHLPTLMYWDMQGSCDIFFTSGIMKQDMPAGCRKYEREGPASPLRSQSFPVSQALMLLSRCGIATFSCF